MSEDLQPLRDWLAAHPGTDEQVAVVRGGDVRVGADGVRHITMPWPQYGPTLPAFWEALAATHWGRTDTSAYMTTLDTWRAAHRVSRIGPEHPATMDRATLYALLRQIDRAERFCDGSWQADYKSGLLHAAARALLALPAQIEPTAPPERKSRQMDWLSEP